MESEKNQIYPLIYVHDEMNNNEERMHSACITESYQRRTSLAYKFLPLNSVKSPSNRTEMPSLKTEPVLFTENTPLLGTRRKSTSFLRKSLRMELWFILFVLFYVTFLVVGSVTFQNLEIDTELGLRREFQKVRERFLQKYSTVVDDDLESFISEIVKINGHGVSALRNATSDLNWSFGQALFFSSTVITTIGYGHVTPLTQNGKLFCIFYASIGIPLTLVLLSAMVERLLLPVNWLLGALNSKLGHLYQPFNIRLLHLGVIVTIFAVLFLAIPTIIFTHLEPSWDFLDAFYYCFVSLTTIGLGDYIPGDELVQNHRSIYKICTTAYLILGLIAMMLILTVFYDIPQLNLGQLFTESNSDHSEKLRLSLGGNTPSYSGPSGLYIPQRNDEVRRSVVRIRPRGDDSPSPDEQTPIHAKDIRMP